MPSSPPAQQTAASSQADLTAAPPAAALAPSRPVADVIAELGVDPERGLPTDDAAVRLDRHGRNEIAPPEPTSALALFVGQFKDLLVLILLGAAALCLAIGDLKDAIVITVVLLLNATLGFVQERRAEQSVEALRAMLAPRARVRRDGRTVEVDAVEVVPGDVLLVEAGDRIAADGRLLGATGLSVDEAALTGESVPAQKDHRATPQAGAALGDLGNTVHANTVVTRGRAEVLVTATGMATAMGQLAGLIQSAPQRQTPLQRQLAALGRRLAAVAGVAVSIVFVIALLQGDSLAQAALDAIALAVAAIPEGLPAVVTVTLAIGTNQMAKRNAIVKRLSSVETLGSATIICSDKTGTLTRNEMTARRVWRAGSLYEVAGDGYGFDGELRLVEGDPVDLRPAMEAAALCNDAAVHEGALVGDPTEGALVVVAAKAGVDVDAVRAANPRRAQLPFDSETKLMATLHPDAHAQDGRALLAVKGAPDVILRRCTGVAGPDGAEPLDDVLLARLDEVKDAMGGEGLRVLAIATREVPDATADEDVPDLVEDLVLEGLIGILDPPRAEARDAIAVCRTAGVRVMMITGDHATTAGSIAEQLGITGEVLTGADLDRMSAEELRDRVDDVGVIARVSPAHKLAVVEALQARGHVVAMTGDGVNDAPAVKGADIGVAMGITGTDVAKDAADLVLADDDFATIVGAVERGRAIYDNIVSFVRFQLATNIGAIATILVARLVGLPAPFTPIQILWVNLIMDGPPALALGVDPAREDAMQRPPRDPDAQILDLRRLGPLLLSGAVMAAGTIGTFLWARPQGEDVALTMAFTTFVLFQFFNALNARVETGTVFSRHTLRNRNLWIALGGVLVLQVGAVHVGLLQRLVDTVALSPQQWLAAAAVASCVLWVEELRKVIHRALTR